MLALKVGVGIVEHAIVDRIRAALERPEQTTDGGNRVHLAADMALAPSVNRLPAYWQLIPQPAAGTKGGGIMAEDVTRELGLILKQRNLGGGRTGVYHQDVVRCHSAYSVPRAADRTRHIPGCSRRPRHRSPGE